MDREFPARGPSVIAVRRYAANQELPPVSPFDHQIRLYEAALTLRKEHYRDVMERWRSIETKAQGAIATTGILIAGVLAFIRELEAGASGLERGLLAGILSASIVALVLGVFALWIRNVPEGPFGVAVERLIKDMVGDSDDTGEAWRDVVREQVRAWEPPLAMLHRANQAKARLVAYGQGALALAALLAVIFCLMRIVDPSSASVSA
jgi:Flp pilus assembly pilin Flp